MADNMTEKERIYEEKIRGLVQTLSQLCFDNGINMTMTFCLGVNPEKGMLMTTATVPADVEDEAGIQMIAHLHGVAYGKLDVTLRSSTTEDRECALD